VVMGLWRKVAVTMGCGVIAMASGTMAVRCAYEKYCPSAEKERGYSRSLPFQLELACYAAGITSVCFGAYTFIGVRDIFRGKHTFASDEKRN